MKAFIKFLLLIFLVVFAFINHRFYSFNKGLSKLKFEDSFSSYIKTAVDIQKVEYYTRIANNYEYKYNVYIETSEEAYLFKATQDDIDGFKFLGIFSSKLQPQKVSPIPFYLYIIAGIVVLAIPTGKKKEA